MIFKKKKAPPVPRTVVRCGDCHTDSLRPYTDGDYVCMDASCPACGHAGHICGIYGEEPPQ